MEESFGIIPLRRVGGEWEVFLVHHQKGHWGFPKGHAESGESASQSASRELQEETGLQVVLFLEQDPIIDTYTYEKGDKQVTYFLAEVEGETTLQQAEIQGGEWLSLAEAHKRLTFPSSQKITHKLAQLLP